MSGIIAILIFAASAYYVHNRGVVKHGSLQRQLSDHSTLMAPINMVSYLFSKVPTTPYLDVDEIPELQLLKENWETIRDEGLSLYEAGDIKKSAQLDDIGFNSFFKTGWTRFYIKWYKDYFPSAESRCPETIKLIKRCPSIKAAMFVNLPPGARLVKHRDPYAGSLRYHLGLQTPNDDDCYINVDDQIYSWRDGEDVLFDETYIHYAENKTDENRIIFFADIERPTTNVLAEIFNKLASRIVLAAGSSRNEASEKAGFLNVLFGYVYKVRMLGKELKNWNRRVYYVVKWLLFAWIFWLIFF